MSERWKPGNGEQCYYFCNNGGYDRADWENTVYDRLRFRGGNCFRTEAEAQAAAEKVKALLLSLHCDETLQDKQLPKLTAEVFDRPDCPEWAKYAAVSSDGKCLVCREHPVLIGGRRWANPESYRERTIDGEFDASDFQNSLIERPATLPDWCKTGEWVYHDSDGYYYTVKSVDIENDNIQISDDESEYTYTANEIKTFFSRARLRPYNAEEMRALVGKVVTTSSGRHCTLVTACKQEYSVIEPQVRLNKWLYATDLLNGGNTIDGKPCGVLEHLNENGEWVK